MAMLGANLADMDALALQMGRTASGIGACQGQTTQATNSVVASVTADARAALSAIEAQLAELRATVAEARSKSDATAWTGANADRFRGAAADFDAAMQVAEGHTRDAFTQFQSSIQAMADSIAEYHTSFAAALVDAQASTDSMNVAVSNQRDQLAAVMNTGLNVGT